ncbi:MAG: hypothetical protein QM767_06395 [Anaeromyxobacter sp.]
MTCCRAALPLVLALAMGRATAVRAPQSGGAASAHAAAVDPARLQPAGPEAARTVEIYVTPYYTSASKPGGPPDEVNVWGVVDGALASTRPEDILAARDLIASRPQNVSPMTLTVLGIRLYDIGQRDEAAFWYYAARERFRVAEAVLAPWVIGTSTSTMAPSASCSAPT